MIPTVSLIFAILASTFVHAAPTALDAATLLRNGQTAQQLNTQFSSLKITDACNAGEQACVEGSIATCTDGKWDTSKGRCAKSQECFAIPSVSKEGTNLTCTSEKSALSIITASGAKGGIAVADPSGSTSLPSPVPASEASSGASATATQSSDTEPTLSNTAGYEASSAVSGANDEPTPSPSDDTPTITTTRARPVVTVTVTSTTITHTTVVVPATPTGSIEPTPQSPIASVPAKTPAAAASEIASSKAPFSAQPVTTVKIAGSSSAVPIPSSSAVPIPPSSDVPIPTLAPSPSTAFSRPIVTVTVTFQPGTTTLPAQTRTLSPQQASSLMSSLMASGGATVVGGGASAAVENTTTQPTASAVDNGSGGYGY
ncbi:hypothetical protein BDQ12DRAFT_710592 [Crucibulum laeve]|uniref:Carbohydrate-binding module family 19 domain-containing protein n=1 Tax=Crucibulum laeve TaxID=68775 RepID=A0A5C3M801_9AGAR|nr:hypothetical protein BDQ12DRAFT_710592 [Crucibulum laeve]